jgi:hypothetical protein
MLSPAPVAKKIADRSEGGSDDLSIDIIDKKTDSSGTTITEDRNNPPETEGGLVRAVEGSELPIGVDPKAGILASNDSSSDDSSSTGGSSKSDTDISSSSSDSTRSLVTYDSSDSDSFIASKANRNKMSSMNKSPVCDGERDSFEEWHLKWEVFGQDH